MSNLSLTSSGWPFVNVLAQGDWTDPFFSDGTFRPVHCNMFPQSLHCAPFGPTGEHTWVGRINTLIFYTSFQTKRGKVGVILLFFLSLTIGYVRTKSLIII